MTDPGQRISDKDESKSTASALIMNKEELHPSPSPSEIPTQIAPKHSRDQTTLIKDINQSYEFASIVSECVEASDESSFIFYDWIEGTLEPSKSKKLSEIQQVSFQSFVSEPEFTRSDRSNPGSFSVKYIPEKLYCPSCRDYNRPFLRMNRDSIWDCILCFKATHSYEVLYCCPLCEFIMTRVEF